MARHVRDGNNLATLVADLRSALGDQASEPRFITLESSTVSRHHARVTITNGEAVIEDRHQLGSSAYGFRFRMSVMGTVGPGRMEA